MPRGNWQQDFLFVRRYGEEESHVYANTTIKSEKLKDDRPVNIDKYKEFGQKLSRKFKKFATMDAQIKQTCAEN